MRIPRALILGLLLSAGPIAACDCDAECVSAAQCPSGVCRGGRCVERPASDAGTDAGGSGGDAGTAGSGSL